MTAIDVYAHRIGVTDIDEFWDLANIVRSIDNAYRAKVNSK